MKKSITFILSTLLATMLSAEQIKKIDFVNLSMISTKLATEAIDIKAGDTLDIQKVNKAIKKFFKYGYFDDISVKNNKGVLEFHFVEKPVIANVSMFGYKTRDEEWQAIFKIIGVKKGTLYTKKVLERSKKELHKVLESEGYTNSIIEIEVEEINKQSISLTYQVNKGDEIIIKKANYFGLKKLDIDDIEENTINNEIDFLPWFYGQKSGELNLAQLPYEKNKIADVYYQHGYLDSKINNPFLKVDFSSNEAVINYFMDEGEQYKINDIVILIDDSIKNSKELYPKLKSKKDRIFNIKKLRKDVEFIKTSVADLGYAYTVVNFDLKKDKKNSKVDIILNVIPGKKVYINDVLISGNGRTLDRVIRRDVYLAPGDLFSLTDLTDSRNKLKRTGLFEDVVISKKRISDDKMNLLVKVKESLTSSIEFGGGYGSYDGFSVNIGLEDKNIFGTGKTFGTKVDTSDRRLDMRIFLTEPAVNDSKYSATFDIHSRDQEIEYSSEDYSLDRKVVGFSVGVGTEINRHLRASVTYGLDDIQEEYTDDDTTDSYDPFAFKTNEDYISSYVTPALKYNSTNDFHFPTDGIKAKTSVQIAGLGGDAKYVKNINDLKYFYSLEDSLELDWVFRYKGSLKYLIDNGKITQGDSFYMGGNKSLRGYKDYSFGPEDDSNDNPYKQSFTNSFEVSLPLLSKETRWGFFYDYGMIGEDSFSEVKRSSVGALFEWISPFGPIQFVFSEALDDEEGDETTSFEFELGASF